MKIGGFTFQVLCSGTVSALLLLNNFGYLEMVLLLEPSPSNFPLSPSAREVTAASDVPNKVTERIPPSIPAPSINMNNHNNNDGNYHQKLSFLADPVAQSNNNNTNNSFNNRQFAPLVDEIEIDSEDDDYSDSSSIYSDGSTNFDSSSVSSLMNESDCLNERRRAMLDLSISKIQTMNASNVAVSLRKSLLIYNTMKSLQRDLDACGVYMCGSLTERGNGAAANDVEMLEDGVDEGDWERRVLDLDFIDGGDNNTFCVQHFGCGWPWDSSEFSLIPGNDAVQGLEKCGGDLLTLTDRDSSYNTGNTWSISHPTDSSEFIEDYMGIWGAWEDENYNPLTNCNLTQAEIMKMFHLPACHFNNQLVSQA